MSGRAMTRRDTWVLVERLIVVAPPQFLGDLRAAMPAERRDCLAAETGKDLSKLKPAEIVQRLDGLL